jgi:hypothetical protein
MYQLRSFHQSDPEVLLSDVNLTKNQIKILFKLSGLSSKIYLDSDLKRANELWKKDCFEAFWAAPNLVSYYELNFNSLGEWNVYEFQNYRRPQPPQETADFSVVKIDCSPAGISAEIKSEIPLKKLQVSLTCILKNDEKTKYFAVCHSGSKPDFHLRSSFTIDVEAL